MHQVKSGNTEIWVRNSVARGKEQFGGMCEKHMVFQFQSQLNIFS